jgi:hypothetical protein
MLLGFTFSGFTPGFERYDLWSDDESLRGKADLIRAFDSDPTVLSNTSFALPSNGDELFRIRRIDAQGERLVWIGIYRHAPAIHQSRSGGYMSTGIWLVDSSLLGDELLNLLRGLLEIFSKTCLRNGEFYELLSQILPAHTEQLRSIMKQANGKVKAVAPPRKSDHIEAPLVFDFSAAKGVLESFFASYLLVSSSQAHRRNVYFFFSDAVCDVLQDKRTTPIVNYWRLIDDEVEPQDVAEVDNMAQATLNRAGAEAGFLSDGSRSLEDLILGSHAERSEILNRLKALEREQRVQRELQKRAGSSRFLPSSFVARLVFAFIAAALLVSGVYAMNSYVIPYFGSIGEKPPASASKMAR